MKTTLLLLCLGVTGSAVVIQNATSATDDTPPEPYIAVLKTFEESSVEPLTQALNKLPGVDEIEAFPGKRRALHINTKDGYYLSEAQVAAVVDTQGLALDRLDIPEWARLRLYVVEAAGGG